MWTNENRHRYDRDRLRYPSDMTSDEWALVECLIPPAKRGGRRREVDVREVLNGIMYVLSTGCQWRYIPRDLPPRSTLHDYLQRWDYDGTLGKFIMFSIKNAANRLTGTQVQPPASIPRGMMRGRKSVARSGIFWSTPRAC